MHDIDTLIHDWVESLGWPTAGLIRLLLAAVCGGLVGLEREVRGRSAGFRTNLLVCLGSATAMVVSAQIAYLPWPKEGHGVQMDPARLAYGVMAGIGFLGAGAILRSGPNVHGLTTAAGIWCVAAIGLAAGLGLYLFAAGTTAMVVAALFLLGRVDHLIPRAEYRTAVLRRPWSDGCVGRTVDEVRAAGIPVVGWTFVRDVPGGRVDVTLRLALRRRKHVEHLEGRLAGVAGTELVSVTEEG